MELFPEFYFHFVYTHTHTHTHTYFYGLPQWLSNKESALNAGDAILISG